MTNPTIVEANRFLDVTDARHLAASEACDRLIQAARALRDAYEPIIRHVNKMRKQ